MIPMMNEYKNLIINFVKEHQKGLKIALLVFLVGGMIFKGLMQIPQINASKAEVAKLTNQIEYEQERQKEIEELKSNNVVNKLKNERGAGRKEMFTEEQKARVKMLRLQGKSYRAIAKDMNCSVATVHKIINEQQC